MRARFKTETLFVREVVNMEGNRSMKGAVLPGNSTVELRDFEIPKPGHGEVLIPVSYTHL